MYSNRSVVFPWEPNHRLNPGGPGGPGGPGDPWKTRLLYSLTMSCSKPRAADERKLGDASESWNEVLFYHYLSFEAKLASFGIRVSFEYKRLRTKGFSREATTR